jgi:Skp family chaperone for outer membrane proteins
MRDSILTEIKTAVSAKAKASGCSLIFDTAAETINGTTSVVYSNGENDLTSVILAQINAGAPIDVNKPASAGATPPSLNSLGNP